MLFYIGIWVLSFISIIVPIYSCIVYFVGGRDGKEKFFFVSSK